MTNEQQQTERELKELKPARLPEAFVARLTALRPAVVSKRRWSVHRPGEWSWWDWFAPALTVLIALALLVVWLRPVREAPVPAVAKTSPTEAWKADDVEIDRTLIAVYDAVARLPTGEPVRFRCFEWEDEVAVRDSARGVVLEQRSPRWEVVPIRFETY